MWLCKEQLHSSRVMSRSVTRRVIGNKCSSDTKESARKQLIYRSDVRRVPDGARLEMVYKNIFKIMKDVRLFAVKLYFGICDSIH